MVFAHAAGGKDFALQQRDLVALAVPVVIDPVYP